MPVAARQAPRRKVGRPPRIDREKIARAAHEVGLADLTVKRVADHLGVSVAGLYHHIGGKDDLLRLAAEYSATNVATPVDQGQHWSRWLLEWAHHNRDSFVAEPALLGQYLEGAISTEAIADNVDAILGVLVRQGFTILEARNAYELVSSCALGSAINAIRQVRAAANGRPVAAEHLRVLAQHDPDELPYLRMLVAEAALAGEQPFVARVTTVLIGIAVERGEPWQPVITALAHS
jgi:AcrR family transcriptional regulator